MGGDSLPAANLVTGTTTKRVLLLLPKQSYRNDAFRKAAGRLQLEIIAAADRCHQLAPLWGLHPIQAVHFDQPEQALAEMIPSLGRRPHAVLAVDDAGQELAVHLRRHFGLAGNSLEAVQATRDKLMFRRLLRAGGLACPRFTLLADRSDALPAGMTFPVVVKARRLSGSRGVLRADNHAAFRRAVTRVRRIQSSADRDAHRLGLIVESFIPGREVALEGLLAHGRLRTLALFDKPDPLDGPAFEESLYVTPSGLPADTQTAIGAAVQKACVLAGLVDGPIHAEARINEHGVWLLEIAARSIGGLCGRVLQATLGMSLEELILRHALALPLPEPVAALASGVLMIPTPVSGVFQRAQGIERAREVDGITDLEISALPGQQVAPPPEGASYLGFVFAEGPTAAAVEHSLRKAHARLAFDIQPELPVRAASENPAVGRSADPADAGVLQ